MLLWEQGWHWHGGRPSRSDTSSAGRQAAGVTVTVLVRAPVGYVPFSMSPRSNSVSGGQRRWHLAEIPNLDSPVPGLCPPMAVGEGEVRRKLKAAFLFPEKILH